AVGPIICPALIESQCCSGSGWVLIVLPVLDRLTNTGEAYKANQYERCRNQTKQPWEVPTVRCSFHGDSRSNLIDALFAYDSIEKTTQQ
ncbi:uncharacterized protein METZ01_LOCUS165690, partial [marine metagenome]